jgi:hypothetical protein
MPFATGRVLGAIQRRQSGALVSGFAITEEISPATNRRGPDALTMSPPAYGGTAEPGAVRRSPAPAGARPGPRSGGAVMLPAPPPVSVRNRAEDVGASPDGGWPLVRGPDGTLRRSLVETTADLFRSSSPTASTAAATSGDEMTDPERRLSVVRENPPASVEKQEKEQSILDNPRELNELVDKVVDKIEQRVVDELERRGRRHTPGVF